MNNTKNNFNYKEYDEVFDKMKNFDSKKIGDIIKSAYNSGMIKIFKNSNSAFDTADEEYMECFVALVMGINMLQNNNISLKQHKKNNQGEDKIAS